MSSFNCERCGALCADSRRGYISGCEHYPADAQALAGKPLSAEEIGLADSVAGHSPFLEWLGRGA